MSLSKAVVAVAGMAGSGKSLVVRVAEERGYSKVIMGDEVRDEAKRRELPPTPENLGKIMLDMRKTEGKIVIAKRCIPKIEKSSKQNIIIDGIRSLEEVDEFRKNFQHFTLIAVHASPETRFGRIYNRKRSDDPSDWEIFRERDTRELSVGLGGAIAMAEYMLVNEEPLETIKARAKEILMKVEQKRKK
jgi:dephospho-CoA kinase